VGSESGFWERRSIGEEIENWEVEREEDKRTIQVEVPFTPPPPPPPSADLRNKGTPENLLET